MGSRKGSDNDGASPGKIFIGGLAKDTTLETFTKYFEKYGEITDFVIMKDRHTGRPRGFGFITFADPSVVDIVMQEDHVINGKQVEIKRTIPKGSSQSNDFKTKKIFVGGIPTSVTEVVDNMPANGNMIDMEGTQVEIKKAEPKKTSNPAPGPAYASESRGRSYNDGFGGFGDYGGDGFGPAPYSYEGFGGGGYGGFGGFRGDSSFGYSSRFGSYAGGLSGSGIGAYGRGGGGYGSYGGSGSSGSYDSGPGAGFGRPGGLYGSRTGYGGNSRYHPYASVTTGYFNNPGKTNEVYKVDETGIRRFYTGDIGQFQHGEYTSLGKVEAALMSSNFVDNLMVYADPFHNYCVALIVPSHQVAKDAKLGKFEIPAKIKLLTDPWTPESGLVTAALK
ncbi:hypothetical protein CRYUN_Cryun23aG0048700 [Craigia yunnanensis]